MENIYHYGRLESDIYSLSARYPFLDVRNIGQSVLGKNLYELRLGSGKKVIHFNASFHGNEWITSMVLMEWFQHVIEMYEMTEAILQDVQLSLVPMVNPDGVDLVFRGTEAAMGLFDVESMNHHKKDYCGWKANIRGVDLNKQFPANWEQYKMQTYAQTPSYRDYPGEQPLSEPEAIAMKNLVECSNFQQVIALHTQGKEFYWGYGGLEPEEASIIAEKLEKISCYKGIQNINSHAGFRDWFILQYRKPGFTIELGKGINPLPLSQFPEIVCEVAPILWATLDI
ncbi:MAG: M14 family metallocarboxypeptidase [Bacillus sp. (in: firmicutes)]